MQIEGVQVPRGFIMGESSRAVAQFAYFSDLEPGNSVFPFGEFYSGWPAVCTDRHTDILTGDLHALKGQ